MEQVGEAAMEEEDISERIALTPSQIGDGSLYAAKESKFLVETKGKLVVLSDNFPIGNNLKVSKIGKIKESRFAYSTLSPKKGLDLSG